MQDSATLDRRVLIVDSEANDVRLLEAVLSGAGYTNITTTTDSRTVCAVYIDFQPDILLLALHLVGPDGLEVMDQLKPLIGKRTFFPIIVVTNDLTTASKHKVLGHSAQDFLTKPLDPAEVLLRVKNLLETQTLHYRLETQNQILRERVLDRTHDLEEGRIETVERLALAIEFRDDDTGRHTQRVGELSALLGKALDYTGDQVELIRYAASLHDAGKIAIADAILLKPGKLTADEYKTMTTHTSVGADILGHSKSPLLQLAAEIALSHHECWDGTGYPLGRRGVAIPLSGRIVSVADVFDALTHERPYKPAWPISEAILEIERLSGSKFDPRVVQAFVDIAHENQLGVEPVGRSARYGIPDGSGARSPRCQVERQSAELSPLGEDRTRR
jgi:putative two-component system response regulator